MAKALDMATMQGHDEPNAGGAVGLQDTPAPANPYGEALRTAALVADRISGTYLVAFYRFAWWFVFDAGMIGAEGQNKALKKGVKAGQKVITDAGASEATAKQYATQIRKVSLWADANGDQVLAPMFAAMAWNPKTGTDDGSDGDAGALKALYKARSGSNKATKSPEELFQKAATALWGDFTERQGLEPDEAYGAMIRAMGAADDVAPSIHAAVAYFGADDIGAAAAEAEEMALRREEEELARMAAEIEARTAALAARRAAEEEADA